MSSLLSRASFATPPRHLFDLFLRDLTSLLITSRSVTRSLVAIQPECTFSEELMERIDSLVTTSQAGEAHLLEPLREVGITLPPAGDSGSSALVAEFFTRLPVGASPAVLAAEVVVNLRLLAQHLELKIRLAAEEALLVGQKSVCRALVAWAREWRLTAARLSGATVRARARAYVADLGEFAAEGA